MKLKLAGNTLVKEFFTEEKKEVVMTLLLYIMNTTEIEKEYIGKCLNAISPEGGQIAMTTAMKLKQEGKYEDAKRMFENGADIDFVLKVTGLPKEEIEQLMKEIKR